MKKFLFLSALVSLFTVISNAQDFEVPKNIPSTKKEFANSKNDLVGTTKWLENTAIDTNSQKRQLMNAWVLAWATNSPTVTIELTSILADLFENNAHLMMVYIGGYSRYCVENNTDDKVKATMAAIRSSINCYKLGGHVVEHAAFTKVVQLDKEGKLEEWAVQAVKTK
jgi:hypothetical protein